MNFYKQKWFMWLALIIFAPLGIFLIWKYDEYNNKRNIILTNVFMIWFLIFLIPSIAIGTQVNGIAQAQKQEQLLIESNKKAAQEVDVKIKALGEPSQVTLEKTNDVKSIRTSYNALSSDQKEFVTQVAILTTAEKTITDLQNAKVAADKAAADKVAADKAAADKAVADKAAADKVAADQAAADQAAAKAAATEQASSQKAVASETQGTTVYTTETGSKYHLDGCQSLNKSQIPISLEKAKSSGLTPCSKCNPPQ